MLQDKQLLSPKEKSRKVRWWRGAKAVISLLILSYIVQTIQNNFQHYAQLDDVFMNASSSGSFGLILLVLVLVPFNWALESLKWQLLAQKAVPVTFMEAFRSTLSGLAVGVAVPAQLGDTLGRVASLQSDQRLKTLGAALISNGIQFYASILGGTVCWYFIAPYLPLSGQLKTLVVLLLIMLLALGLLAGAVRKRLPSWNSRPLWLTKIRENLAVISHYTTSELIYCFGLGMTRYLVYVMQFALVLTLFGIHLSPHLLIGCIGVVLLAKTLLPVINAISDLGIREFTALYVFAPFHLPTGQIVAATFFIWFINILAPLLLGMVLIWKHKWSTRYA